MWLLYPNPFRDSQLTQNKSQSPLASQVSMFPHYTTPQHTFYFSLSKPSTLQPYNIEAIPSSLQCSFTRCLHDHLFQLRVCSVLITTTSVYSLHYRLSYLNLTYFFLQHLASCNKLDNQLFGFFVFYVLYLLEHKLLESKDFYLF